MKWFKRSVFDNMVIWYLLLATAIFATMAIFTNYTLRRLMISERTASLQSQARLIATQYAKSYFDSATNNIHLQEQLQSLQSLLGTEIWIADSNGQFIAVSSGRAYDDAQPNSPDTIPTTTKNISSDLSLYHSFAQTGQFYNLFSENTLSVGIPLMYSDRQVGYIFVHSTLSDLSDIKSNMLHFVYLTYLVVLLSSLLFLYHFTRRILNPLDKINQTARAYSNGSFDEKLEITDKNEIGELANSLNNMADELQKMEDYRKNFIANVSHDFRSPLTSINGYLKAIQEGVIPPERQSHYIDVVLNETKRLTKLTSGLLALNDFNSNSLIVKKSVFNINEIILNTIDAFEGNAIKKNVSILPDISNKPLKVYADKEKIYQVLYNLIDNALKFSHPNSTIFVTALPAENDKVSISVKDNGDGISKEHQKHIWERFYKADSSRGKDKSGTGLGLSIVREIIKAHDETITLQSKAGSGSTFAFTLPAVKESTH